MKPKRTRKQYSPTQKRSLVNKVTNLITKGHSITGARELIAGKHGTTPISLARWSKDITNTIVRKSNGKMLTIKGLKPAIVNVRTSKVHVTGVDLHVPGKGTVKLDTELLTHISKLAGYTG